MSGVRVLVGTRKGAFVLTSDARREQWDISEPHFEGWEMFHLKGSPADPNRVYASLSGSRDRRRIQRSSDGGVYHGAKRTAISEYGERQFRTKSYTDFGEAEQSF